jgi:dihydroxyacetone kinase-like protein
MPITREVVIRWIQNFAAAVEANKDLLIRLDSAIGDGDHGANMHRGMQAALVKLPSVADKDIGAILKAIGMTLVSTVGGASGPLYGTLFLQIGAGAMGKENLSLTEWTNALETGVHGVMQRGKAVASEKTMLDALLPAVRALKDAAAQMSVTAVALDASANAAEQGRDATIPMLATKGRASYLGERSIGHQDPGATSSALLMRAVAEAFTERTDPGVR